MAALSISPWWVSPLIGCTYAYIVQVHTRVSSTHLSIFNRIDSSIIDGSLDRSMSTLAHDWWSTLSTQLTSLVPRRLWRCSLFSYISSCWLFSVSIGNSLLFRTSTNLGVQFTVTGPKMRYFVLVILVHALDTADARAHFLGRSAGYPFLCPSRYITHILRPITR